MSEIRYRLDLLSLFWHTLTNLCCPPKDLICCDGCPNVYHLSCLGLTSIDDDKEWFCRDCTEERTRNLSPRKFAPSPSKEKPAAAAGEASTAARQLII